MDRVIARYRWLAALVLAGAIVFAACGGEDGDSGASVRPGGGSKLSDDGGRVGGVLPPATDGEGAGNPASLPSQLDRKIIQVATISVTTETVSENFENVGNIAAAAGGFVSSSTFGNDGERQTASITIKVPAASYQDTVGKLRRLGDVAKEDSNTEDITEQFTDLQSRLRNLQATEAQYLDFLENAGNLTEVLTLQDRINITRSEIEQVQGRIDLMSKQTDLATITVHLAPPVGGRQTDGKSDGLGHPLEVAEDAFDASLAVLLGLATIALAVGAFSWWLLPLVAVAVWLSRRQAAGSRPRE
jgi:hypothetical protein